MCMKNLNNVIKFFICIIVFSSFILLLLYLPFKLGIDSGNLDYPAPNKVRLGDSNMTLDRPWGEKSNLKVYVDLDNVSKKDREYYIYEVLLAMRWWENDSSHNLSYDINFTLTNDSDDANIVLGWNDTLYGGRDILGHTLINSSGDLAKTCDPYNPPFSQCKITILTNLSDEENLFVIKHELGHALGLRHSFNTSDFFITYLGFSSNYLISRSEIMFDFVLFNLIFIRIIKFILIGSVSIAIIACVVLLLKNELNLKTILKYRR